MIFVIMIFVIVLADKTSVLFFSLLVCWFSISTRTVSFPYENFVSVCVDALIFLVSNSTYLVEFLLINSKSHWFFLEYFNST